MISELATFANDCYHIFKAPTGSKAAILKDLIAPGEKRMGFRISHFDRKTLNYLYREIFSRQPYFFRSENLAPVILDCGANVGMATLYFKWLYPQAHVQAFEPDPNIYRLLQQTVAWNDLEVQTHDCALWDQQTDVELFVNRSSLGSLLTSTDGSRSSNHQSIKVRACKLSDFIAGTVDFLKMDVEGAEHRILYDLVQSGKIKNIRQMVVEYHHRIGQQKSRLAEFLHQLEQAGFDYQINARLYPVCSRDVFQDVLIAAYQ
jgi:FkbM family methyltransferase